MSEYNIAQRNYGIYVHIPFCKSKCDYCSFISVTDFSLQKPYVTALIDEISASERRGCVADSVYIGGGTPSCLYGGAIHEIFSALRDGFKINEDAEITVECNPESATYEFAEECHACGVNRISMGLQSSCDKILKKIGRVHDFNEYLSALNRLKRYFDNLSSDIILGLPYQNKDDVARSIDVISDGCDHISVYALSVEYGTALFKSGYTPDDDYIADLYDFACGRLADCGYTRYEVSNFARKGKQSRHNNKYWNCEPYLGFGAAAHGYDGEYMRSKHADDIGDYISAPHAEYYELTDKDRFNEYVMLRMRTENGLSFGDFKKRFGYSFRNVRGKELSELRQNGYTIEDNGRVRVAPEFMFVMNSIIEKLMLD